MLLCFLSTHLPSANKSMMHKQMPILVRSSIVIYDFSNQLVVSEPAKKLSFNFHVYLVSVLRSYFLSRLSAYGEAALPPTNQSSLKTNSIVAAGPRTVIVCPSTIGSSSHILKSFLPASEGFTAGKTAFGFIHQNYYNFPNIGSTV